MIAVIAWMAGMLYLPRLFIYHCEAPPGSPQSETFKVMERRLLTVIINPAMVLTWVLGHGSPGQGGFFTAGWLHAKLALVLAMSACTGPRLPCAGLLPTPIRRPNAPGGCGTRCRRFCSSGSLYRR